MGSSYKAPIIVVFALHHKMYNDEICILKKFITKKYNYGTDQSAHQFQRQC